MRIRRDFGVSDSSGRSTERMRKYRHVSLERTVEALDHTEEGKRKNTVFPPRHDPRCISPEGEKLIAAAAVHCSANSKQLEFLTAL